MRCASGLAPRAFARCDPAGGIGGPDGLGALGDGALNIDRYM